MIHGILPVQFTCLIVFLHNLCPNFLWSTSWPGTLHFNMLVYMFNIHLLFYHCHFCLTVFLDELGLYSFQVGSLPAPFWKRTFADNRHLVSSKDMMLCHSADSLKNLTTLTSTSQSHHPLAQCFCYWPHTESFYGSLDFVRDNPGEPVPDETSTHSHLSWSSIILHLLPPSVAIHGILPVQFKCMTVFLHNLCPSFLWSTSWSGTSYSCTMYRVFFSQHMPTSLQSLY